MVQKLTIQIIILFCPLSMSERQLFKTSEKTLAI